MALRHARLALALAAGLLLAGAGAAQSSEAPGSYALQGESRFWIEGTTTVDDFACTAAPVRGRAAVAPRAVGGTLAVPVAAFDCGIGQMNRDLQAALRGDAHPEIRFGLQRAEAAGATDAGGWVPVRAWGTLSLAGAERLVALTAQGRRYPDGRVRIRGRHPLLMTDFGVEPPARLLGLVRVHDRIVVHFDLVAAPAAEG